MRLIERTPVEVKYTVELTQEEMNMIYSLTAKTTGRGPDGPVKASADLYSMSKKYKTEGHLLYDSQGGLTQPISFER